MKPPKPQVYHGWYVLGAAFVILFLVQGGRAIIGVAFKPIISEFAWNRGAISLAVFLNMAVFALMLTVVGTVYDRYGARWVVIVSTLFIALGYAGIALVETLWQFILCYGVFAAIGFGGTSIPLFAAMTGKWFSSNRGLAISTALAGGCLGHYAVVLIVTRLVIEYDWRSAFICIGLFTLVVNLVLALSVIKEPPAEYHANPLGAGGQSTDASSNTASAIHAGHRDLNLPAAMRTKSFWLFTAVMFVCGGGDYLVITHLVPMVTDYGISTHSAGSMLAWYGLVSLVGVLATGRATDKIGNKIPVVATFVIRVLVFGLVLQYQTVASFYVFALVFGFTMLVTAPITTTLMAKLYGFAHVGLLSGVITTVHHLSGGLWAYGAGVLFDRTGSYRIILISYAVASLIAIVCGLLIREQRHTVNL